MTLTPPERPLRGPIIGTIIFVVFVPGSVVGLVPFLLSRWHVQPPFLGWLFVRWIGVALFLIAAPFFVDFVARFVWEGRGTPAPVAPTRRLVVGGPFRYVRNPGYLSVLAMIFGQGLFFGRASILLYAVCVALGFHLFVVFYEEPTLRTQFGDAYEAYCRHVPRWMPRRPRPAPGAAPGRCSLAKRCGTLCCAPTGVGKLRCLRMSGGAPNAKKEGRRGDVWGGKQPGGAGPSLRATAGRTKSC